MFPSKSSSLFETSEMNRLFSQSIENDAVPHYSLFQSPVANRSSSSAESVSPESYFNLPFQFNQELNLTRSRVQSPSPLKQTCNTFASSTFQDFLFESPPTSESPQPYKRHDPFTRSPQIYESPRSYTRSPQIHESPRSYTRSPQIHESPRSYYDSINIEASVQHPQRPIIGRKILGGTSQAKTKDITDSNFALDFWQDSITPPNSHPKSYELFPRTEEFEQPISNRTPLPSPSMTNMCNNMPPRPRSTCSNYTNITRSSYNPNYTNFKMPQLTNSQISEGRICMFCRKNGETPMVYGNHCVKEKVGGKYIVTCPILRSHKCQTCGVSGDNAHTITYCPVLRSNNNGKPLTSTTIKLKNTKLKSNGKPRY